MLVYPHPEGSFRFWCRQRRSNLSLQVMLLREQSAGLFGVGSNSGFLSNWQISWPYSVHTHAYKVSAELDICDWPQPSQRADCLLGLASLAQSRVAGCPLSHTDQTGLLTYLPVCSVLYLNDIKRSLKSKTVISTRCGRSLFIYRRNSRTTW